ncbi:hypothetical protein SMALA_8650 (plasmid) [Streptomyces malaysiensis subsp. malaysiensis]|nr:hypothetical protein SMALA_8650 [Streptomyces malaysiensis]
MTRTVLYRGPFPDSLRSPRAGPRAGFLGPVSHGCCHDPAPPVAGRVLLRLGQPGRGGDRAGVSTCAGPESTCRRGETNATRRTPMPAQRLSATMSGTSSGGYKTTESRTLQPEGPPAKTGRRQPAGLVLGLLLGGVTSCVLCCVAGLVTRRLGG